MRRLGEPASRSRSWVRGNFHITLTPALSLTEGEGTHGKPPLPAHPHVVITGSVNSSELTLFDPVIHASRPAVHVDGRVRARP